MASTQDSVDDYLDTLDPPHRRTLRAVIDLLVAEFDLAPVIAWNVPQLRTEAGYVFGLAAFKKHLTLNPWSGAVMTAFADRLEGYKHGSHTFQVPVDWELDEALLRDLVRARLAELG